MSIKAALLAEAKSIDTAVELDSIFESVELSSEVKAKFSTVFESVVKQKAVALAESHIEAIASRADELVEAKAEEKLDALSEQVNKYFDHIVESWLTENKLAVENGLKVQMFESLLSSMKDTFVEHNIIVPTESVDVIAEIEDELAEAQTELSKIVDANVILKEEIRGMKREKVIAESIAALTDVQKDKVMTLSEGIEFSDTFATKLESIVEMVGASKPISMLSEKLDSDADGLNFKDEKEVEKKEEKEVEKKEKKEKKEDGKAEDKDRKSLDESVIDPAVLQYMNFR